MPDANEEPSPPIPPEADVSKAQSAELNDDDKALLAAFREDMRKEEELLNRWLGAKPETQATSDQEQAKT